MRVTPCRQQILQSAIIIAALIEIIDKITENQDKLFNINGLSDKDISFRKINNT